MSESVEKMDVGFIGSVPKSIYRRVTAILRNGFRTYCSRAKS